MGDTPLVGVAGTIRIADVGASFPAGPATPYGADWKDLGLTTVDGVTVTAGQTKEDFGAWQVFGTVRTSITGRTLHIAFSMEQWDEGTVMFAYGGGEVTPVSGGFEFTPPVGGEVDFRALAVEVEDGDLIYRWHIPRGLAADDVETVYQKGALGVLPIGFDVMWPSDGSDPWTLQTNDTNFISDFLSS